MMLNILRWKIRPEHRMVPPVVIVIAVDPGKRRLVDNVDCISAAIKN
jgi:hypothetical protein